jgi:centromere protein J
MSKKLIFNEQNIGNNDSSIPQTNSTSFNQMNTPNPYFQMDPETLQNFIMFQNFMKMQNMMSSSNTSNVNTMASTIPQNTLNVQNSKEPNESPNVNSNVNTKSNNSSAKLAIESNNILALENNHRANTVNQSIEKFPTEIKVNKVNKLGEALDNQAHNKTNSFSKNSRNAEMDERYLQNHNDSIVNSPEIEANNKSHMNNHLIVSHDDNHELSNNTNNNISDISGTNLQNKEVKNRFDEMPIKKGPSNFLELLEQNLQNEGEFQNDGETKKRIIKHERFKKVIKVSTPDEKEKKKYKYYLQNFDKRFGEDGYAETNVLPPPIFEKKEDKSKAFKTKSKSVQKFVQKGRKVEVPSANEKEKTNLNNQSKDKNGLNVVPIANKKTAVVDKKKESGNSTIVAKKGVKKSENLNNIWGEQNNAGDDDYDDFLDLEREAKKSLKKIPINPINSNTKSNTKAENLNQSPKAQSKLKENLNFNVKTDQEKAKFNIGFNMPKDETENKIELKSTQINQVKSKTLNQILNNHYHTNQPKNPFYESKLNSELNKLNMMNHGIDLKEIEDFKEENEEGLNQEDYISESEEAKHQVKREKSPKSEESDDRNIEEMFKNSDKIQSSPLEYKDEKDEFSSKQYPENTEKQVKKTQITNMTNVTVKPSIIKKNVNPVEAKKQMNENAEDYKDNYTEIANEKLRELNNEIVKLKSENEKASKMKHEYEKLTILLQQEIKEFNDKKERELREFENYKEEEKSKLLKEKKLFDKNLKALQNQQTGPNRKEREEIESLKQQIQKITEESKKKETTNKLAIERLKRQLDEANNKVSELSKELKNLEELRLKSLGKYIILL